MTSPVDASDRFAFPPRTSPPVLPVYERAACPARSDQGQGVHAPAVVKLTPVQLQCLPDARPEEAPVGFRYRPLGKDALLFEVTVLGGQAVDAGYRVQIEPEDAIRLRTLAAEVRRVNHVNNWARTFNPHDIPAQLELIHTEISEAYRTSATDTSARMDELGDVTIRTLELLALIEQGHVVTWDRLDEEELSEWFGGWDQLLLRLHDQTDLAMEAYRKIPDKTEALEGVVFHLIHVIGLAWGGILHVGVNVPPAAPMAVLTNLIRRNSVRGLNHGGRRL